MTVNIDTSTSMSSLSSSSRSYIEHPVSKFDTLAGVAIMYGVEVADIKKINGLVTDHQMFALKSLRIPLPGRHPPSPCLSHSSYTSGQCRSGMTPPRCSHSGLLETFQSLKMGCSQTQKDSPAMSSLRDYYGLKPVEDIQQSSASYPRFSHHRKSRSVTNIFPNGELDGMLSADAKKVDSEKRNDKFVRRRQKSEADFNLPMNSKKMHEENIDNGSFSKISGKGLALRTKAASRPGAGVVASIPKGLGDSHAADAFTGVKKSISTPSFQDQECSSSSIWSTSKWNLKPDLQAVSTVSKPVTGRKTKAALD